jgi:Flp pilus assembly protein TadD
LAALRKAVQLEPKSPAYHRFLANQLRDDEQFQEAVVEYQIAIAGNPGDHDAHLGLGLLFERQGNKGRALQEYRKAVELKPDEPQGRRALGLFYLGERQWDLAVQELQTLAKLKPGDKDPVDLLRLVYTTQGPTLLRSNPVESAAAFRKALELRPDDLPSWQGLGIALVNQGKKAEARAAFRKALEINPRDGLSRFRLGMLGLVDEEQEALVEWGRADQLLFRENLREASAAYQKVVALKPSWVAAYWNLAMCYQSIGELTKARDTLKRYREFGPPSSYTADGQLRTVERLIEWDRKLPALAAGKEKPGDTDRVALAGLCLVRRYPRTAVRLYVEAFAAKPEKSAQADGTRYNAACAAAQAAAGQGKDATELDDAERTRLRQRALDWLKADLAVWTRYAQGTDAQARTMAQRKMEHWQSDAYLAEVRDEARLEKLPRDQRDEWRKLWDEVGEVLKKARRQPTDKE